jgi:hypothetical protein
MTVGLVINVLEERQCDPVALNKWMNEATNQSYTLLGIFSDLNN